MKSPRHFLSLAILVIAAASLPGLTSQAEEAGNIPLPLLQAEGQDDAVKSLNTSQSGFDYYATDPYCEGSCIHSDYWGYWSQYQYYNDGEINGVWGVDGRDVYYCVSGWSNNSGILHYHEGMQTLETIAMLGGGNYNGAVWDIWGFSTEDIFAVGSENWETGTNLFQYSEGSWQEVFELTTSDAYKAIWGTSSTDIYTVGYGGDILHYDGETMTPMTNTIDQYLLDIWGTASDNIYAVGWHQTMLHFDGVAWAPVPLPSFPDTDLNAIWGSGPDDIFVVGGDSTILHWDGTEWTIMPVPISGAWLMGVHGSSHNEVVAVGSGVILHFDGTSWEQDPDYTGSNYLTSVWGGLRSDGDQYWSSDFGAQPEEVPPGFDGWLYSVLDVGGVITVGGYFQNFGSTPLNHIAAFNGTEWQPVYNSTGPNQEIHDLAIYNGNLVCAGYFTDIDGTPINGVAVWDGSIWSQLGAGLPVPDGNGVWDLVVDGGTLYALGESSMTAMWDGSSWTPLSFGTDTNGELFKGEFHDGDLYAGGFNFAGSSLKILTGTTFLDVDANFTGADVYTLLSQDEGLYVGGQFTVPGYDSADPTSQNLGIWNGSSWDITGAAIDSYVLCLKNHADGMFVSGWYNYIDEKRYGSCAIWDKADTWTTMGSGVDQIVWDASISGENMVVVGNFYKTGNRPGVAIGSWQPQQLAIPSPPVTGPATAGEDYHFSINVEGDPGAYPVYLNYRVRDGEPFQGSLMTQTVAKDGMFETTVPEELFGEIGFQYFVTTGSGTDPVYFPDSGPDAPGFTGVTLTNESLGVPSANQYIMMGVPFMPDKDLGGILTDALGSYNTSKWRFGRWDPTNGDYDEYPNVDAVAPGRGYWLIQKNPVDIPATGVTTSTVGNVVVTLEPGWNMVATPYNFPIDWADVILGANVENRLVARAGGGYTDVTIMNPWQGYWVRNVGLTATTITIQPIPASGTTQTVTEKSEMAWQISFNAERGELYDRGNVAGVSATGEPGIDVQDYFEAPAMPGDVSLFFEMADDERIQTLSRDVRAADTEGEGWDMVLRVPGGGTVELTMDGCQDVPLEKDVVLITPSQTYNLRENRELRITVGASGETRLRLAVGNPGFVDEQEQTLPRPYALGQAYPNPFNPRTTVSFSLPKAGQVNIDIFDVRGHLVQNLVDDSFEAGLHEVTWQGFDNQGRSVSAGVYFCRMRAGDFSENQKMTLVK